MKIDLPHRIHIVGIGGIGLSGIARVLLARGVQVSGSDLSASPLTEELAQLGARISIGQRAENVGDVDLVLITSAAREDNPEIVEARRRGIRIDRRYDFFPQLTAGKKTIAIAGTHGKTTTTALIALTLVNAGLDPTVIVGGIVPELSGNARAGNGEHFVIEADEYERAFLGLRPAVAVITSVEMDHPDIYHDVTDVERAFGEFVALAPREGVIVACGDSERVTRVCRDANARVVRYGFESANDLRAMDPRTNASGGSAFSVWRGDARLGEFALQIPGRHNVLNALAAIAVAEHLGIERRVTRETLRSFRGVTRRFEIKAQVGGVTIVDDYAHHPSEILATLAAARARYRGREIWAVFQPHTFSRTRALLEEFANAFGDADHVIITDIYAARETDDGSVNSRMIVERMKHADARFIAQLDEVARVLASRLRAGDVLITLGAGDVNRVGDQVRAILSAASGRLQNA